MNKKELHNYIAERYTLEDIVYYLEDEIDLLKLVQLLDKSGVNLRIFEDFYEVEHKSGYELFADEQD